MYTKKDDRIEMERQVLCVLCQGTREGPLREFAQHALQGYRWSDSLHAVLFETLTQLPASANLLRQQLPSILTRRGFPDVDCESFFVPHNLSRERGENLIHRLRDL